MSQKQIIRFFLEQCYTKEALVHRLHYVAKLIAHLKTLLESNIHDFGLEINDYLCLHGINVVHLMYKTCFKFVCLRIFLRN